VTRAAEERREARGGTKRRSARSAPRLESGERPRTGAKRTVMDTIRQLPNYVRLLFGLLRDKRVATVDKLLVAGAIAYILAPVDLIPDWIPFLGEVDDVFLLVTALQRLISNAGRSIVLQYWLGNPADLAAMNLRQVLTAAAFFLPRRVRRRLRTIGRG
jgi:uncharacterized membrane protein YkvA (DUF1232 family)